jgi:hypothetical protein
MKNLINKYDIFHYSSLVVFSSFFLFFSGYFGLFEFNVSCSDSTDLVQGFALSSIALTPTLSDIKFYPNYVTGFVDGEWCFSLGVSPSKVQAVFQISLHINDRAILEDIKGFFGVGYISKHGKDSIKYQVCSIKDLLVIIEHFDKYPLITQKGSDYLLLKQAVELIKRKQHLTKEGLHRLVSIKGSMNWGLSPRLTSAFPNVTLVTRPPVQSQVINDPYWVAGFVNAEGCFSIDIVKSQGHKLGYQVRLRLRITQHIRDKILMGSLVDYFDCGVIEQDSRGNAVTFSVSKFSDLESKIIPFFSKYLIQGVKSKNFEGFCIVAGLIKSKSHLTEEGLEKIRQIKSRVNA